MHMFRTPKLGVTLYYHCNPTKGTQIIMLRWYSTNCNWESFKLTGTMFYNFIGNGNNFFLGLPLNLYFYCKQTTRKCEGLLMHSTINTSNKELCNIIPSHLRVYNLLQLQGNINIFLPEIPLKVQKFYSVEYHLNQIIY